jgi:hypothetical protein
LRTSCWDLPQNEQYKVFFESLALLMAGSSPGVVPASIVKTTPRKH